MGEDLVHLFFRINRLQLPTSDTKWCKDYSIYNQAELHITVHLAVHNSTMMLYCVLEIHNDSRRGRKQTRLILRILCFCTIYQGGEIKMCFDLLSSECLYIFLD